jgi:hypothetical protein
MQRQVKRRERKIKIGKSIREKNKTSKREEA